MTETADFHIICQVLTSKLSGLDLNDGRARGGDSGVVRTQDLITHNNLQLYKLGWCVHNLLHSPSPRKTLAVFQSQSPQKPPVNILSLLSSNKVILQVSPSEASTEGERERLLSETNSKTRSHSGEDAGIGSEQGELQLPVEIFLGK